MHFKERISLLRRGYKLLHKLTPQLIPSVLISSAAGSLLPFVNIFMSAQIITAISVNEDFNYILFLAILTSILNVVVSLINAIASKWSSYNELKFWTLNKKPIKDKIQSIDYELIENTDIHHEVEKIRSTTNFMGGGLPRLFFAGQMALSGFFKVVFSISLLVSLFTSYHTKDAGVFEFLFSPIAAVIMGVVILANIIFIIFSEMKAMQTMMNQVGDWSIINRKYMYYFQNLFYYKGGKDVKLNEFNKSIVSEFNSMLGIIVKLSNNMSAIFGRRSLKINTSNAITSALMYAFVGIKALFGAFGVGNIVQYAGCLTQLNNGLSTFISQITQLLDNAEHLKVLFDFLDKSNEKYKGTLPIEKRVFCDNPDYDYDVEFKNVSFKYPGTDVFVLKNLNLKLHIGKKLAVVGMNGSGKTTMIKLLCRLYDPTDGEITLNGVNIQKYDYDEYMSIFSVVFQDFKLFSFGLGQNVAGAVNYDKKLAEKCLKDAGLGDRLKEMPKKLETCLYKDFEEDGVEISGGEAQKIALARALYKRAPFIVLDEPTAALDPLAEFEIYSKFNEIVKEKTAIYISHRLSSCRFCDDIIVFDDGKIVQRGNHEELIEDKNGKYNELWCAQAQYYSDDCV